MQLYDQLAKSEVSPQRELKSLPSIINSLPLEINEIIYALILHHYFLEQKNKCASEKEIIDKLNDVNKRRIYVPYRGAVFPNGKGITFEFQSMPSPLQKIIARFIDMVVE